MAHGFHKIWRSWLEFKQSSVYISCMGNMNALQKVGVEQTEEIS